VREHDVSVVTAVSSLLSIADILKEIGSATGKEKVDVNIRAPQPGSVLFDIVLFALAANTNQLIQLANSALDIAKMFLSIWDVAKTMGGERPGAVSVETRDGNTVTQVVGQKGNTYVFNGDVHIGVNLLASNPVVQKGVKNIGEVGKKDDDLDYLSFVLDSAESKLEKADFDTLEKVGEEMDLHEITDEDAQLTIIRPSFDQKLKSDFYYQGSRITCSIQDAEFYKEIDGGKKFAKGDVLESKLIIRQKLDPAVNIYINHSYILAKVKKHIPRNDQTKLL
jgi:hypothetical protein